MSGVPALNTLMTFSGVIVTLQKFDVDGNVAGNPTSTYTGRGELIKVSGDLSTVENLTIRNTHVKDNSCGLYITGKDVTVRQVVAYGAGRVAIRDKGDRTRIDNVRSFLQQAPTRFKSPGEADYLNDVGNKVIAKDGGAGDASGPFEWVHYSDIQGSASHAGFFETIVIDDSLNVGGRAIVENVLCNYPAATGPDVVKFVNVRRVDISGLTTIHAGDGSTNTSLRFQEGVQEVYMQGLDLAGHVNFDTTTYVRGFVSGDCHIGRSLAGPVCIDDFPDGVLVIQDGAVLSNFLNCGVAFRTDAFDGYLEMGSCLVRGAPSGTPSTRKIAEQRAYLQTGVLRRLRTGQVRVAAPIEIYNTRTATDGRWILDNDTLEAAAPPEGLPAIVGRTARDWASSAC
jgi:cytoskeletal protein CcmA (bactofilin family)